MKGKDVANLEAHAKVRRAGIALKPPHPLTCHEALCWLTSGAGVPSFVTERSKLTCQTDLSN